MPRYYRKVIKIRAADSPNVRWAEAQLARGLKPTGEELVPGVVSWDEYRKRRAMWDKVRQCIGLDAEFYEGAENLLFPPDWLNRAEEWARMLVGQPRKARAIGIDPAEGDNKTSQSAVDDLGLIEQISKQTPNTAVITSEAIVFMRSHGVPPEQVFFDRGGGGKQHADRLREQGYRVQSVAFGAAVTPEPKRGVTPMADRRAQLEDRYAYLNRRAEMYGTLRNLLDPSRVDSFGKPVGFAIPAEYTELRRQLSLIPLMYDKEGRLRLPPKRRVPGSHEKSLEEILGCSPDEADSLVLGVYGLTHARRAVTAGAF